MFNPAPRTGGFLELEGILQGENFMGHSQGGQSPRSVPGVYLGSPSVDHRTQGNKSETGAV